MNGLLRGAEALYRGVNRLRRSAYRAGLRKPQRLPRPVISIGSLDAGGAGKTPLVIAVARFLGARGKRVAVLTRGYGRRGTAQGLMTTNDSDRWGDEPVLIKKSVEKIDVIVGNNRFDNASVYLGENDCDLFILDDGFQHLQLFRDVDVVIDNPSAGFLREGRSALADAGIVLRRGSDLTLRLTGHESFHGEPLFAFSGLADNGQFFQSLRDHGLHLAAVRGFPDHHRYQGPDLEAIKRAARDAGAAAIITTEKDGVKIEDPGIVVLRAEAIVDPSFYTRLLELLPS